MNPRWRRTGAYLRRELGGQGMLVPVTVAPPDEVFLFLLDGPVAESLWAALELGHTSSELTEEVLRQFEAAPAQVVDDVAYYLDQLRALGAIAADEVVPAPIDLTPIPVLDHDAWLDLGCQQDHLAERLATTVLFEITYRCNFDCAHCYVVQPGTEGELSTSEVLDVLEQLRDLGVLFLALSGGEALTRPDFETIYTRAKELGFLVQVFTNGALIKERHLELFRRLPPQRVEITLYGASEGVYEEVTRRRGMFDLVMSRVRALLAAGVPVYLKAVDLTLNHHELGQIRGLAAEHGTPRFRSDQHITERLDCRRGPTEVRLAVEQVIDSDRADAARVADFRHRYARGRDLTPSMRRFTCGAGNSSLVVDPFGRLTTCTQYRVEGVDLRQTRARDAWRDVIPEIVAREKVRANRCTWCDKRGICDSCAGANALESLGRDPDEPSDFACAVTHARVRAFCADLRPPAAPSVRRELPVHRARECRRPWLSERGQLRPVVTRFVSKHLTSARGGRPLPLATAST
jgi:radical SAM protein with 4Fe4S-binding SPASM domain